MKPRWLIRRELKVAVAEFLKDKSKRIFAVFPTLTRLRAFLHFVRHQALQLVRKLKLILAAAINRALIHEHLIERQVRQERPRTPRPRPLALRPAAPHLAPPA